MAQDAIIRCASLNANGLFSGHGELKPSWQPFAACLHAAQFDALALSEPHLWPSSNLPGDGVYRLAASPNIDQRRGRRDAAIATRTKSLHWCQLPGPESDIVAVSLRSAQPRVQLISAYAPDISRGQIARADFFDRLDVALRRCVVEDSDALRVLCIDANSWNLLSTPAGRRHQTFIG